jgi:hypothetical protein
MGLREDHLIQFFSVTLRLGEVSTEPFFKVLESIQLEELAPLREKLCADAVTNEQRQWVDRRAGCWAECEIIPSAIYSLDLLTRS